MGSPKMPESWPIQYRDEGMYPCTTITTGNGPAPSGSEMVPVMRRPALGQLMWYLLKPAPRSIGASTWIVPPARLRSRRDSM